MTDPIAPERILNARIGGEPCYQVLGNPRTLWPREAELTDWLADNLDQLASCLGLLRLEYAGREVVIGERWTTTDLAGREQIVGGMWVDLTARDDNARLVIVEAQFGPADHTHLGQLITYACTTAADLAVWVVADTDPVFYDDHLTALAELNHAFAGRREFCVVMVTLESQPSQCRKPRTCPCALGCACSISRPACPRCQADHRNDRRARAGPGRPPRHIGLSRLRTLETRVAARGGSVRRLPWGRRTPCPVVAGCKLSGVDNC
jgi:hypothetical protein